LQDKKKCAVLGDNQIEQVQLGKCSLQIGQVSAGHQDKLAA
jgi:hypothetical protein